MQQAVTAADSSANAAPPASPGGGRMAAIGLMCLAVSLFACLDASAKYLVMHSGMPAAQIIWMRLLGQLTLIVFVVGAVNVPELLLTARKPWHQLLRSMLLLGSTAFNFMALASLRLDQALTVQFLAPLVVALLAGPLLGEWVGWRRMLAILAGFGGILIAIRPGTGGFQPAILFAFACMLSYSCFILITRYLAAFDSPTVTLFYSMLAGSVLFAPVALTHWVWPHDATSWVLLGLLGVFASSGHFLFILAYRFAPASTIAPFLYTQLVAVTTIGWLVFADIPDVWTVAGSTIIILSGIYLVHREHVTRQQRRRAAASSVTGDSA